jgi:hypothetical protein
MAAAHMQQMAANIPRITGQKSLNDAIEGAEGDEDLEVIRKRLQRRGLSIPPQLGPGTLKPVGGGK